ncbi:glycosyltransferase family 2 protein [Alteromonas oceani]|uniref:Glycosyltransferase family 2 protein n=1 Tax=Alteromonas oceani TaxID=2071609 RepID=A0ABV7JQI3_9ALTE|nr:glycosyltransferase family 2 protein [Alteromonas oceani]
MSSNLSVLILTHNEELHIRRCIESLKPIVSQIFVVDSGSTDKTIQICEELGVRVFRRKWKNYSDQFQWGLDNCPIETDWVMRMDADEYIEPDLIAELPKVLAVAKAETSGFYIRRKYFFLGQWIKHGAVYPLNLLRVWRTGKGRIESRWMDEHIVLDDGGQTEMLSGHIVDDNLNNTKWWTDKHNKYADREMVDILGRKYSLFAADQTLEVDDSSSQAKIKRLVKEKLYNRIPLFVRPLLYFLYRYFIRLGFLDGKKGFAFHFFQGYWYRSMVDLRVLEAEKLFADKHCDTKEKKLDALAELTGLELK